MGRVIINGPPPGNWCLACLMTAKQRQWEAHQGEIQAGADKGGDELTVIPWPEGLTNELAHGDYRAVCGEFPHLGVVDGLCWAHVAGINPAPMPAGLLDTSAPAALARPPRRQERRTR